MASDCKYISVEQLTEARKQYEKVLRLINGYVAYLKRRKKDED